MKITVAKNEPKQVVRVYPYIGVVREPSAQCGNHTVLFTAVNTGFVLKSTSQPVGHFSTNWAEPCFTSLDGSVTLSND